MTAALPAARQGRASVAESAYQTYRGALLSPQRVRELSHLRPYRAVADTLRCWLVILAAWALVALFPAWWTVLLAIPIVGCTEYALFIIAHDALHRRIFPTRRDNDRFADLFLTGPVGAITRLNNRNHLNHHHYLSTAADPDRHKHGCFNKTTVIELFAYVTGLASVLRTVRNVFVGSRPATPSAGAAPAASARGRSGGPDGYTARDVALLAGWQIALIAGLTLAIGWWAYPVLWLLPVYAFTFLGDNLRSFAEHSHPETDRAADRHRLISYTSNPLEQTFVAPMNMNCHAAHHLWPSIPYYNLPQADREMRAAGAALGLEWRASYFGYLCRYLRALPLPECKQADLRQSASATGVPTA